MKKKVLIVDDDPTSLKIVESVLTLHGYEIQTSTHAQDIENKVKAFGPDLIVMDLMMPEVDGNQAVRKLQSNATLKTVPIVFLTALQMRDEERGLDFEVNVEGTSYRTLTKPLDARTLVASIRELTGQ